MLLAVELPEGIGTPVSTRNRQFHTGEISRPGLSCVSFQEQGGADKQLGFFFLDESGDDLEIKRVGVGNGRHSQTQGSPQMDCQAKHMKVGKHSQHVIHPVEVHHVGEGIYIGQNVSLSKLDALGVFLTAAGKQNYSGTVQVPAARNALQPPRRQPGLEIGQQLFVATQSGHDVLHEHHVRRFITADPLQQCAGRDDGSEITLCLRILAVFRGAG